MPLYMDRHDLPGATAEDVARARGAGFDEARCWLSPGAVRATMSDAELRTISLVVVVDVGR